MPKMPLSRLGRMNLLLLLVISAGRIPCAQTTPPPVRVVIAGLVHDHARGLFGPLAKNPNVQLAGIAEADTALAGHYAQQFHLDSRLFYPSLDEALDRLHPDAVLVYTDIQH